MFPLRNTTSTAETMWSLRPPSHPPRRGGVSDYYGTLCDVVRPLIEDRGQLRIYNPLDPSVRLQDQDIQGAHSTGSARPLEDLPGIFRPRHQPPALLVSPLHAGWQVVKPPKRFNRLRGKNPSCSKAIVRAFNRLFKACSVSQNRTLRRHMSEIHHHHRLDPSYLPFDQRGVSSLHLLGSRVSPLTRSMTGSQYSTFDT